MTGVDELLAALIFEGGRAVARERARQLGMPEPGGKPRPERKAAA